MRSEKMTELIRHPEKIGNEELRELNELVRRYPYFQTARILYLKALYLQGGTPFRNTLKTSTVHIADHKQLFRYLNQQLNFNLENIPQTDSGQTSDFESHTAEEGRSSAPEVLAPEVVSSTASYARGPVLSMDVDLEEELSTFVSETETPNVSTLSRTEPLKTPEILSSGYLLDDNQVTEPIEESVQSQEKKQKKDRKKKDELIEQFILADPGMPKITDTPSDTRDLSKENPFKPEELFSETLAKIYIRQHLYEKAIATYIKLSLKYPEKSIYFADRIEKIKENINNKE